jgi:hypothetical protein
VERIAAQRVYKYVTRNKSLIQVLMTFQFGLTHGFVMQFETAEDRDYYIYKDPVHLAFAGSVGDKVDGVRVLDFKNGVF